MFACLEIEISLITLNFDQSVRIATLCKTVLLEVSQNVLRFIFKRTKNESFENSPCSIICDKVFINYVFIRFAESKMQFWILRKNFKPKLDFYLVSRMKDRFSSLSFFKNSGAKFKS